MSERIRLNSPSNAICDGARRVVANDWLIVVLVALIATARSLALHSLQSSRGRFSDLPGTTSLWWIHLHSQGAKHCARPWDTSRATASDSAILFCDVGLPLYLIRVCSLGRRCSQSRNWRLYRGIWFTFAEHARL